MIKNILASINTSLRSVSKEECYNNVDEAEKIRKLTMFFIKEYAAKTTIENWDLSPMPVLCEVYVNLTRISEQLNKLLTKFLDKKEVRFSQEEEFVYKVYINNLKLYQTELKHLHYISLTSNEG